MTPRSKRLNTPQIVAIGVAAAVGAAVGVRFAFNGVCRKVNQVAFMPRTLNAVESKLEQRFAFNGEGIGFDLSGRPAAGELADRQTAGGLRALTGAWRETATTQAVHTQGYDGITLVAYTSRVPQPSAKWAVIAHGIRSNHRDTDCFAAQYAAHGYNTLQVDLRSHGESEGDLVGIGWLDAQDLLQWCHWLVQEYGEDVQVVLHGQSMGAAATCMAASADALPHQVKAAISDCAFSNFHEECESIMRPFGPLSAPVINTVQKAYTAHGGCAFKDASPVEAVKHAQVPMLFIHGEDDDFVPASMVHPLHDACTSRKQLLLVPGAGHCASHVADPRSYFNTVFAFCEQATA
ncbi:MAG: alpha/beta hydrolase [Coriobacteriia bacterium]|nr:alpha/beta hydrolase [Coriobacteriia bacterium]